jgi:cellulose synthase/poly-beta-1,6-N-acetylglucosamine synthase-like glycosyltransferase
VAQTGARVSCSSPTNGTGSSAATSDGPCFKLKISLCSPNAAQFVGNAIQSALEQTYPNLEVVVVDDGSTDGLTDALRPLRDRMKLVIQPH